jgi:hypothetical protein
MIWLKTFFRVIAIGLCFSIRDGFKANNFDPIIGYLIGSFGFYLMTFPIVEFYRNKERKHI